MMNEIVIKKGLKSFFVDLKQTFYVIVIYLIKYMKNLLN